MLALLYFKICHCQKGKVQKYRQVSKSFVWISLCFFKFSSPWKTSALLQ